MWRKFSIYNKKTPFIFLFLKNKILWIFKNECYLKKGKPNFQKIQVPPVIMKFENFKYNDSDKNSNIKWYYEYNGSHYKSVSNILCSTIALCHDKYLYSTQQKIIMTTILVTMWNFTEFRAWKWKFHYACVDRPLLLKSIL